MTVERTRVLVVDDSRTVRARLTRALAVDPALQVVGEADDGGAAAALCAALRPDVVTMDLTMPSVGGLEATERIMATCPTAILVVAEPRRDDGHAALDALAAGAVDAIEKPTVEDDGTWDGRFRAAVRLVAGVRVVRRTRPVARRNAQGPSAPAFEGRAGTTGRPIAALGASMGGPAAVSKILCALPRSKPVTVLLCMHLGAPFAGVVVEWLGRQTPIPVRFAENGEPVVGHESGARVLLAPPGAHLVLRGGRLELDRATPERHGCRPSIDVLFESVARELGSSAIGCLLTGMGDDGARGLRSIRDAGGVTIAQDEATSAAFGMPGAAIEMNAADWVLPLSDIGSTLSSLVGAASERRPA